MASAAALPVAAAVLLVGTLVFGAWALFARAALETELASERVAHAELQRRLQEREERVRKLEFELTAAITQREEIAREAERVTTQRAREREAAASRKRAQGRGLAEGVRVALVTCNELLASSGHGGLRFLHATAITPDGLLREPELVDADAKSLRTTLYLPDSLAFRLDRRRGILTLALVGGVRVSGEEREPLPTEGFTIEVRDVDARAFEARLPMLVVAEGSYPEDVEAASRPRRMPVAAAEAWCERINEVLGSAKLEERWRCERLADLEGGWFQRGLLVRTKGGRTVRGSADVERFAFRIDAKSATVSLVLAGGTLHASAGDTSIPGTGYAILLPGLDPRFVRETLLGIVVDE